MLVDSSTMGRLAVIQHLASIALAPEGRRVYGLASGADGRMAIAVDRIESMDEPARGGTMVFVDSNTDPIPGDPMLGPLVIEVVSFKQTRQRLTSTRLRGFRPWPPTQLSRLIEPGMCPSYTQTHKQV